MSARAAGPGLALGDGRHADVAALPDGHVERDAAEEVEAVLGGEPLATAAAEDLGQLAAVRAGEGRHVLDQAEDRDAHPLEHRERLRDVGQRDLLRRRHEHRARDRHRLGQRQLRVGGARRQVDDEVVEVAPVDVAQELLDRAADERPAPDDRLALGDEELDRDDLDAVALQRPDLVALGRLRLARRRPSIIGMFGPVMSASRRPDGRAGLGQRDGEVDADRALADAALARRDGDDVLDARERAARPGAAGPAGPSRPT